MKPARLILIVVALLAGGLAAIFALNRSPETQTVVTAEAEAPVYTNVLVASETIGVGMRISADMVTWQEWPEAAVRREFITEANAPEAVAQLTGSIARFEIFAGEPVQHAKLVTADSGYLSAVISPGMRAVSVMVDAQTGAGGFIVPNDHVDVIVTRNAEGSDISETILANVRVIALGSRLGEKGKSGKADDRDGIFVNETVATLELMPGQVEKLTGASYSGQISLALRSVADFAAPASGASVSTTSVQVIRAGETVMTRVSGVSGMQTVAPESLLQIQQNPAVPVSGDGADAAAFQIYNQE